MDPRDEGKFLFKLHTVDMYFWTAEDARMFVDSTKKILRPEQLQELHAPQAPAAYEGLMSPVVQQLENVAFKDPAYSNGQTRDSRTSSIPVPRPPAASGAPGNSNPETSKTAPEQPATYAPLAYNPAAPAAPEPIKHREKTPPPPESEMGTGLSAAAYADHGYAQPPGQFQSSPPLSSQT